jgi:hypothetical protein
MNTYGGVDVSIDIIFYFGITWMYVVSFTPRPLYLRIGGWVGPRVGVGIVE